MAPIAGRPNKVDLNSFGGRHTATTDSQVPRASLRKKGSGRTGGSSDTVIMKNLKETPC